MKLSGILYSDNMRVSIESHGSSIFAWIHEANKPPYAHNLTIVLNSDRPAELAAWEALAAALAAQDVPAEEEM
jgi:hypothetical protein